MKTPEGIIFQATNKLGKLQPLEKTFAKDYFAKFKINEMPVVR